MKNIRDLNVRGVLPTLMVVILCFGCATSGSKRSGGTNQLQTAAAQPVILVPVFILSPPDDDKHGNDRQPAPNSAPPEQSIGGWPAPPPEPYTHL